MSVQKGKRKEEAVPVVEKSRDLYTHMLKLMADQQILERPYRPSLAKSITTQAQAIMHCIAMADKMCLFGKNARARRRLNLQLDAIDGIQVLISDLYILYNVGTIGQDRITQTLQKVVELDRLVKQWMQHDRMSYDRILHSTTLDNVGFDDHIDADSEISIKTQGKKFEELFAEALQNVPERQGIVNNPTGPNSPVIEKVRNKQKYEGDDSKFEDIVASSKLLDESIQHQK